MSSEALEAKRLRENATRRNMMGLLMTCEPTDVLWLLAEVARLEQELAGGVDAMREVLGQKMRAEAAEAALAVAREREQRAHVGYLREIDAIAERYERQHERLQAATGLLREFYELQQSPRSAVHADGPLVDKIDAALAALDAPAAATMAVPGRYQGGTDGEDSASAAADEPGETP